MSAELLKRANDMAGGLHGSEGPVNFHGQFLADLFVAAGRELPPGPVPEMVTVPANEFCEMVAVATERYLANGNAAPFVEPTKPVEAPPPANWGSEPAAEPIATPPPEATTEPKPEATAATPRRGRNQA